MRYDVDVGGVTKHVTVVRTGDGFAVTLDGQTFQIDAARIDGHTLSLLVDRVWPDGRSLTPSLTSSLTPSLTPSLTSSLIPSLTPSPAGSQTGGRPRSVHDITVAPGADGTLTVRVGTIPLTLTVDGRRLRARRGGIDSGSGPQRLVAPMPGKVVRVLAAAGDAVTARQPLVVVEAMKMENELRAERDGTVAEVHAREGLLVEAGALLVVVNPGAPTPRSVP